MHGQGAYTEGIRLVSAGRLCLSIYPFMSGNQALSRKRFQAKQTQQNTNKWRHTTWGGAAPTRGTLRCKAGQRGRAEGEGVSTTLMMSHRITSQDAKVTTESLCEWNEWKPTSRLTTNVSASSSTQSSTEYLWEVLPHPTPPCAYLTSDMKEKA